MSGSKKELTGVAKRVLSVAKKKGAQQAAAGVSRSRFFSVRVRNGETESLEESSDRGLSLRLFVDGRYSEVSTSDLRPDSLDDFVERGIEVTRLLDPEPDRRLPEPELFADMPTKDLENYDPAIDEVPKEKKMQLAFDAEKATRGADPAIFQGQGRFYESEGERVLVTSEGFEGFNRATAFFVLASAHVHDRDNRRQSQWWYRQAVRLAPVQAPESIGMTAAQRALRVRGAGPIPTGTYDMVLENRAASWLLRLISGPMSGRTIYQDQSFLKGKIGEQIAAPRLTITDNPLVKRGLGSRHFDGEGIAARVRPVVEKGILKSYFLDTFYARKLGLEPTSGSPSNLVFGLGERSAEDIVKDVEKGIWVTQFLGGNSNSLTGDYSAGVGGFLIEDGKLGQPFAEVNIGGKVQELLMSLAEVGNDPFEYSSHQIPTLKFPGVSVSGT